MEGEGQVKRPDDMNIWEELLDLDCTIDKYQDLQDQYTALQSKYTKEIENSRRIQKSLEKCLKFYSKLCKKCEAQQSLIDNLKEGMREKMNCLEESLQNQEKMKGVIDIYKRERSLFSVETNSDLRRDKEILLDICCQLISESVRSNNIRNLTNLLLRKFRNDLDEDKLNLLKSKHVVIKKENTKVKELYCSECSRLMPFANGLCDNSNNVEKKLKLEFKKEKDPWPVNSCAMSQGDVGGKVMHEDESQTTPLRTSDGYSSRELESSQVTQGRTTGDDDEAPGKTIDKGEEDLSKHTKELINRTGGEKSNQSMNTSSERHVTAFEEAEVALMSDSDGEDSGSEEVCSDPPRLNKVNGTSSPSEDSLHSKLASAAMEINKHLLEWDSQSKTNSRTGKSCGSEVENTSRGSDKNATGKGQSNTLSSCNLNNSELENDRFIKSGKFSIVKSTVNDYGGKNGADSQTHLSENVNAVEMSNCVVREDVINDRSTCNGERESGTGSVEDVQVSKNSDREGIGATEGKSLSNVSVESDLVHISNNLKTTNASSGLSPVGRTSTSGREPEIGPNLDDDTVPAAEDTSDDAFAAELTSFDEDLSTFLREMTSIRLLSPIKDVCKKYNTLHDAFTSRFNTRSQTATAPESNKTTEDSTLDKKRSHPVTRAMSKSKKLKVEESAKPSTEATDNGTGPGFLDSILSAMSIQNSEFKLNVFTKGYEDQDGGRDGKIKPSPCNGGAEGSDQKKKDVQLGNQQQQQQQQLNGFDRMRSPNANADRKCLTMDESVVKRELQKFVTSVNSTSEDADRSVRECVAVLRNATEETLARVIVSMVFEDDNEKVVPSPRPLPPMTPTQNRLTVLLSILKTQDPRYEDLITMIMAKISSKLIPDTSFWPDDTIEMASRFYMILCKNRNCIHSAWKFCLHAMTGMRRRSFLVVFTALKIWPEILNNATTSKNNILAVTVVTIFLHMPKRPHTHHQQKLLALRHLLTSYYEFKVEESVEEFATKILDSFFENEPVYDRSLILLAKCRDPHWTRKYLFPRLLTGLRDWSDDCTGQRILMALKQILPDFVKGDKNSRTDVDDVVSCLTELITSKKLSHNSEVKTVEVLLGMKQYSSVRRVVREWIPKEAIDTALTNEIIKVASENILQELKFNRSKEGSEGGHYHDRKKWGGKNTNQKKKKKKKKGKGAKCKGRGKSLQS